MLMPVAGITNQSWDFQVEPIKLSESFSTKWCKNHHNQLKLVPEMKFIWLPLQSAFPQCSSFGTGLESLGFALSYGPAVKLSILLKFMKGLALFQ